MLGFLSLCLMIKCLSLVSCFLFIVWGWWKIWCNGHLWWKGSLCNTGLPIYMQKILGTAKHAIHWDKPKNNECLKGNQLWGHDTFLYTLILIGFNICEKSIPWKASKFDQNLKCLLYTNDFVQICSKITLRLIFFALPFLVIPHVTKISSC